MKRFILPMLDKALRVLEKPSVRYQSSLYRRIQNAFNYGGKEKWYDDIMAHVRNCQMQGDYFEFGVFEGRSLIFAYYFAKNYEPHIKDMMFHAFDSFGGIPETSIDQTDEFTRYDVGNYSCDLDRVKKNIKAAGCDLDRFTFTPGRFRDTLNVETLNRLKPKKASVILIDSDIYESAVDVLEFCNHIIQDGTVLMFDEWFGYKGHPDRGERRAFKEWTEKHNVKYTPFYGYDRQGLSFIIHK